MLLTSRFKVNTEETPMHDMHQGGHSYLGNINIGRVLATHPSYRLTIYHGKIQLYCKHIIDTTSP